MSENQPIILSETGTPFSSAEDAVAHMKSKEMNSKDFKVTRYQGGYAIIDVAASVKAVALGTITPGGGTSVPEDTERYYLVRFSNLTTQNDVPHVPLVVNGWDLRVTRNKEAVLSTRFKEAAEHSVQIKWERDMADMKNPMKANGTIERYPFTIVREATRDEFEKCLAGGNALQNEFLSQIRKAAP